MSRAGGSPRFFYPFFPELLFWLRTSMLEICPGPPPMRTSVPSLPSMARWLRSTSSKTAPPVNIFPLTVFVFQKCAQTSDTARPALETLGVVECHAAVLA